MLTMNLFQSLLLTILAFSSVLIANAENNMPGDLGRFGWSEWGNCDFTGSDIAELSNLNSKDQCGNECYKDTECTHFTWTAKNGHVCFLKHFENPPLLPTNDFNNIQCGWISSRGSQPEILNTPTRLLAQWNDDIGGVKWTTSCSFYGPDGSLLKTKFSRTAELCRADCAALSNCTHFNWSSNGNCELKHFNLPVPAYSFDDTICGSVTRPSVTPLTTPAVAETTQSSNTTYQWISSTTQPSLTSPGQDGFSDTIKYSIIGVVLPFAACLLGLLGRMIYLNKKRERSVRFARERLLGSGDLERINPELSIEEQVDLLPYDLKWEFPRNRIILGKQLGAGQFGVVYQAKQIGSVYNPKDLNPRTVAVKMAKSTLNLSGLECLASELKILIHLGPHLNVVNLLGACTKGIVNGEILVIEEFCFYGNLRDYLVANRDSFINEITADESSSVINANGAHSHLNSGEPRELQEDNKGQCMRQSRENPLTSSSTESWTSHLKPTVSNTASVIVLFRKCNQDTRNPIVSMNDYGCTMPSEDGEIKLEGNLPTNCGVDISTRDLIYWSSQIASGMNHLASRKVIHGDLAARNVLLAEGNIVKIADFGLSRQIKYNNYETYMKKSKDEALPVKWMAIESLKDQVFTRQSDVWSFGVVLWELFSLGNMPYPGLGNAISKLCSKDVDLSIKNNHGWTVLQESVHPKAFKSCPNVKKNRSIAFEIILDRIGPDKKFPVDLNAPDKDGNTLLHYAVLSGFEKAVVRLLLDGARPNATTCRRILPSTWETYLDSCITISNEDDISSVDFPVTFDYSHLVAPLAKPSNNPRRSRSESMVSLTSTSSSLSSNVTGISIPLKSLVSVTASPETSIPLQSNVNKSEETIHPECELLWYLSRSPKHQHLLVHPLVASFLLQKWHRIRLSYYLSLVIYAVFLALSSTYLIQHIFLLTMNGTTSYDDPTLNIAGLVLFLMSALFVLWSAIEFIISPFVFLLKFENWIGLSVHGLTFYLVTSPWDVRTIASQCALFVLLSWTQWLILLSRHPKLSMYVTMFTTVSITFLRLLVWYASLLLGFALALFFLFDLNEQAQKAKTMRDNIMDETLFRKEFFSGMLSYFLRVLVMMTGEQDFGNLRSEGRFEHHPLTSRLVFLAFLFLITIVLFSFLNAMAVSDIRDIRTKSEIFYFTHLVKSLAVREALFMGDPCKILPGWTIVSCCWRSYSNPNCITRLVLGRLLLFYGSLSTTKTFKMELDTFSPGSREWITHYLSLWENFFNDACYQLDEEIIRSAQQKVLENRQRTEKKAINYEIDTLREDIQEILNFLKPSRDSTIPEEDNTEAQQPNYRERRKTVLTRRKKNRTYNYERNLTK